MKKSKATVIVRDTSSWPDILSYTVSWRYPKGLLSYGAYKYIGKCLKRSKGITQKLIKGEQSFLYATHRLDLISHSYEISWRYPKQLQIYGVYKNENYTK